MFPHSPRQTFACLTIGFLASAALHADQDAPPPDVNQILKQLQDLQKTQAVQIKTTKQAAIQKITSAASNNAVAVELWEEAVRATQMEGAGKEDSQFRAWRDSEGELFKEKEVQNALHLHFQWMLLTLQRSNGATVKDLLPAIINYSKEVLADQAWMEALDDTIKKEKAQPPGAPPLRGRNARAKEDPAKGDEAIKRTHDSITRRSLAGTIDVQWLKLADYLTVDKWELTPANLDGIYKNIVQPELRSEKDQRVFDYWDMKLKKEADLASKSKLTFEIAKFNNERRPSLMWERAQEYTYLGQKNRAVSEMFNIIKNFPAHPDANEWISTLQALLAPAAPETPATSAAPAPAPPPATTVPATAALPGAQ